MSLESEGNILPLERRELVGERERERERERGREREKKKGR